MKNTLFRKSPGHISSDETPLLVSVSSIASSLFLAVLLCRYSFGLDEDSFLIILKSLEKYGAVLAIVESLVVFVASLALGWSLKTERRPRFWIAGAVFAVVALAANMADYFGTLSLSPDLALESSPIWNALLSATGIQFAKLFGLCGKTFISLVAGACVVYYLRNVHLLLPTIYQPIHKLFFHIGERSSSLHDRVIAFTTVFAFYFAAINLFSFYIAYANSLVTDLTALSRLPPLPAAVAIALIITTLAFALVTFRLQKVNGLK